AEQSGTAGGLNLEMQLNWTASNLAGLAGYHIYRATASGTETLLATVPKTTTTLIDDGNLVPALTVTGPTAGGTLTASTKYYYEVTAYNAAGDTIASVEQSGMTDGTGDQTLTLNWTTSSLAPITGYHVYRGTSPGGENLLIGTIAAGNPTTLTDTGIAGVAGQPPAAALAPNNTPWPPMTAGPLVVGATAATNTLPPKIGDTFTITDDAGTTKTFEFVTSAAYVQIVNGVPNIPVVIKQGAGADSQTTVANKIATAINNPALGWNASALTASQAPGEVLLSGAYDPTFQFANPQLGAAVGSTIAATTDFLSAPGAAPTPDGFSVHGFYVPTSNGSDTAASLTYPGGGTGPYFAAGTTDPFLSTPINPVYVIHFEESDVLDSVQNTLKLNPPPYDPKNTEPQIAQEINDQINRDARKTAGVADYSSSNMFERLAILGTKGANAADPKGTMAFTTGYFTGTGTGAPVFVTVGNAASSTALTSGNALSDPETGVAAVNPSTGFADTFSQRPNATAGDVGGAPVGTLSDNGTASTGNVVRVPFTLTDTAGSFFGGGGATIQDELANAINANTTLGYATGVSATETQNFVQKAGKFVLQYQVNISNSIAAGLIPPTVTTFNSSYVPAPTGPEPLSLAGGQGPGGNITGLANVPNPAGGNPIMYAITDKGGLYVVSYTPTPPRRMNFLNSLN
ncbi:MAG: hypothetical protein ACREHD_28775, partial [Pirellulales bacterium]